jgi:RHH-type rel operon transcriptional repressor/antitoxin RelB
MSSLTVDLDDETLAALARLARETGASRSELVARAVHDFIETTDWRRDLIRDGLSAANAGDFATDEEIGSVLEKARSRAS